MAAATPLLAIVTTDKLRLSADGKIIDFLDDANSRPDKPEERVRQTYGRTLHFDYGYPKNVIAFEAPIAIGSETKFADIVIYQDATAAQRRDQSKILLIVETKAPDEKRGVKQLMSYVFASSAQGGVWINTTDAPKYFRRSGDQLQSDWPNIPRYGEDWDSIGKHKKQHLRPPHNLVDTFRRCHNALYKNGIDSEDLAMDMVRMILAKYRDEFNEGDTCEFRCSALELKSGEGRRRVAERVRNLFVQVRDDNRDVFDEHERLTAGDREIAIVVSELQDFRFLPEEDSDEVYDIVGAAYEVYVGAHLKGDRGQYFTHRAIVRLMVDIVDPSEHDIILDPAMGPGGFLIASMRYVTQKIRSSNRAARAKRDATTQFHRHIFGIDKSPKLVKVARTNMILATDGHSGIVRGDTLEPPKLLEENFFRKAGPGKPTVILTNPPFGATTEHKLTAAKEPELLAQFDLGHVWKKDEDGALQPTDTLTNEGVPPEHLFIERCIRWVSPGGRVGIVVPRGILTNEKAIAVRTLILRETKVLAVVNCHDDTFKPHTDAKTALLVLERKKTQAAREDDYSIFMAISQAIGHTGLGEPIYKTDEKGDVILKDGEPIVDDDIDEIRTSWIALQDGRRATSEWYFKIKRKDIEPFSLNLNPVRYLPRYRKSRQEVLDLGEREGWAIRRLGGPDGIARVFGGPRLSRTNLYVTSPGPSVVRFFTGNAVTQTRGENIKLMDLQRAKPNQLKMIEQMILRRGMILITRSGTTGRVVYATAYHDGAVGTEDVIRVVVDDEALRGYVYQFLLSRLGQDQLKRDVDGAIVDHIEAKDVAGIMVPVPQDGELLEKIGMPTIRSTQLQERAYAESELSRAFLGEELGEDAADLEIARARLAEIERNPSILVSGDELTAKLNELLS